MSLSQDPVYGMLRDDFVCGTRDITGMPWSGFSGVHPLDGGAVFTTNGAGPHNIQMFVLAQDGTVLTCLPGFWNPQDLALELRLAEALNKVWIDLSLSLEQKKSKFSEMQLGHITSHPADMVRRSRMQGFDQKFEAKQRIASSDTILSSTGGMMGLPMFKTTDVIFHERLARQPFVKYQDFDVVAFSDYGRAKYDKKEVGGQPAVDTRPQTLAKQEAKRQMQLKRQKRGGRKG